MTSSAKFVAVDLGASSGRVFAGLWDGQRFQIESLHRFANGPVKIAGRLHWDVLHLWTEIQAGLQGYQQKFKDTPQSISVDTWGVDFALLDKRGRLVGNPYHYRDDRTAGIPEQVFRSVSLQRLFQATGVQSMSINTLFQLYSMALTGDEQLEAADSLLMIPDFFLYCLCGDKVSEITEASTTEMLLPQKQAWAVDLLKELSLPHRILSPVTKPGTVLNPLLPSVLADCGIAGSFPAVTCGSHDTASAVAAIPELTDQDAFLCSGTWNLMGMELSSPILSEEALQLDFTNEVGVNDRILFMKNLTGLWILQESVRQWNSEGRQHPWSEITSLAQQATPFQSLINTDAEAFSKPGNMPEAIRRYCKEHGSHVPETYGEIVRCSLESLALRHKWVLDTIQRLSGRKVSTLRMVGGGCQNELLCQFTADACQIPVVCGPIEASTYGNVMVQAIATSHISDIAAGRACIAHSIERTNYQPDTHAAGQWEDAYFRLYGIGARGIG